MSESVKASHKRTNSTADDEDAVAKRVRKHGQDPFARLPVEIILQIIGELMGPLEFQERIRYHRIHPEYNQHLARVSQQARALMTVSKQFRIVLTRQLLREVRLPREFSYIASTQMLVNTKKEDRQAKDPHTTTDLSAAALARALEKNPELAAHIQKLHICPVVREGERAAMDCNAYRAILHHCKDTVEELAIAVNPCDGAFQTGVNKMFMATGKSLVLERFAEARMPKLKHLILKFDAIEQLNWISWKELESLERVTIITASLFDIEDDERATESNLEVNNLYQVLIRLPATVKTLTWASQYTMDKTLLADIVRPTHDPEDNDIFEPDAQRSERSLIFTLCHGKSLGYFEHLKEIRLVTATDPYIHRCNRCLNRDRRETYPMPQLRAIKDFGDKISSTFFGDVDQMPLLSSYEIWLPPGFLPKKRRRYLKYNLEVFWQSLLYSPSPDEVGEQHLHPQVEARPHCPNDTSA